MRFSCPASVLAVLCLAVPAFAAPPRSSAPQKPKPVPKSKGLAKTVDAQTLVSKGKRPAFFDPRDLSKPPVLSAPSAILIDADTGQVLWEKNADVRRAPASTTKILTALLFIEHARPTDVITVMDPKITKIEESSLHLRPWEKLTAKDLLYGLMLRSANDGAVVVAHHVAGSVSGFATMMNAKAKELGATNSQFKNPNGLTQPGHYSTARDLAVIARAALAEPRFADAVGTPKRIIARSKVTQDTTIVTRAKRKFFDKFPGADGVKTGYTRAAGHCFVGSATRDGRRLLSVVLGAKNSAIADTIPLLSWGFQRFPVVVVTQKGELGRLPVRGGSIGHVPTVAGAALRVSRDRLKPLPFFAATTTTSGTIEAPVRQGQMLGQAFATANGQRVGSAAVPVYAASDVPRSRVAVVTQSKPFRAGLWVAGAAGVFAAGGIVYGAATTAKSARRRRGRFAAARRANNRARPGRHRRSGDNDARHAGGSGRSHDHSGWSAGHDQPPAALRRAPQAGWGRFHDR